VILRRRDRRAGTRAEEKMERIEFEQAARKQNEERAAQVAEARKTGGACDVEIMFAFGGTEYCRTHRVMGPCPYRSAS
jgi:hypothetical protein